MRFLIVALMVIAIPSSALAEMKVSPCEGLLKIILLPTKAVVVQALSKIESGPGTEITSYIQKISHDAIIPNQGVLRMPLKQLEEERYIARTVGVRKNKAGPAAPHFKLTAKGRRLAELNRIIVARQIYGENADPIPKQEFTMIPLSSKAIVLFHLNRLADLKKSASLREIKDLILEVGSIDIKYQSIYDILEDFRDAGLVEMQGQEVHGKRLALTEKGEDFAKSLIKTMEEVYGLAP